MHGYPHQQRAKFFTEARRKVFENAKTVDPQAIKKYDQNVREKTAQ